MPKVKQIGTNSYQYICECGAEIELHQDFPLKRAIKCFQCGKKDEIFAEKKHATTTDK
jgi:predicted SprT family Zn-dependent metalloprotease